MASPFSFLVVRLEDLILRREVLVRAVCRCAGGEIKEGGFQHVSLTKGPLNSYLQILNGFGNTTLRTAGYRAVDLSYFESHMDYRVIETFRYRCSHGG